MFEDVSVDYNGWKGDLIMCPSQIEKIVISNDKQYHFYLRWRWDDPWTVECNDIFLNEQFSLYYTHDNYTKLLNWLDDNLNEIFTYTDSKKAD